MSLRQCERSTLHIASSLLLMFQWMNCENLTLWFVNSNRELQYRELQYRELQYRELQYSEYGTTVHVTVWMLVSSNHFPNYRAFLGDEQTQVFVS